MFGRGCSGSHFDETTELDERATGIVQRPDVEVDEPIRDVDLLSAGNRRRAKHVAEQLGGALMVAFLS
jgi:hypothetical protein